VSKKQLPRILYAAEIIKNSNQWKTPTNSEKRKVAEHIILSNKVQFRFGYEEWFNDSTTNKMKIAYLECYRQSNFKGQKVDIMLFTRDNRNLFHVGMIYGVEQLDYTDINVIIGRLTKDWLIKIHKDFCKNVVQFPFNEIKRVYQHWYSTSILKNNTLQQDGFAFNIRYDRLELYDKNNWVNLTMKDSTINQKWKRLSKRYIVNNLINPLQPNSLLNKYISKI
jgi:hypothetical protein